MFFEIYINDICEWNFNFNTNLQMQKVILFLSMFVLVIAVSCSRDVRKDAQKVLEINADEEFQVMHSFGASDAWRCQFVGANWPEKKKEQMARWLFSTESDSLGNPLGIGLSMWRFYIGAGSMEQGESSGIVNPWRRAECFLDTNGNYNWLKQQGQQWFLEKAREYGVDYTMAFTISAPVQYTLNGKAFSPKERANLNIQDDKLDDYAGFLAEVCLYFEQKELGFDYLSPINEPQWDWSKPTQEGTPATNEDIFRFSNYLDEAIVSRGLDVKQVLTEAAQYEFLTQRVKKYGSSTDQIAALFTPESPLYIGGLKSVAPVVSGHSYFTTWPVKKMIDVRRDLRSRLDEINPEIDFWQSEFCILEKNDDIGGGNLRDLGMGTALYVARVMHYDLSLTNASSWQWWTAISQCNFKDGLIYLDNGNNGIPSQQHPDNESLKYDGFFHDSKLMWAMGNYSRFVRPGMVRVHAALNDSSGVTEEANELMVTAFKDNAKKQLVLVLVNYSAEKQQIAIKDADRFASEIAAYVTSEDNNLSFQMADISNLEIEPGSIKTLLLKML